MPREAYILLYISILQVLRGGPHEEGLRLLSSADDLFDYLWSKPGLVGRHPLYLNHALQMSISNKGEFQFFQLVFLSAGPKFRRDKSSVIYKFP